MPEPDYKLPVLLSSGYQIVSLSRSQMAKPIAASPVQRIYYIAWWHLVLAHCVAVLAVLKQQTYNYKN